MQKALIVAALAAGLGMGGAASAADIYSGGGSLKDAPVYPVNTWAGFYVGTNGGEAWAAKSSPLVSGYLEEEIVGDPASKLTPSGGFGGGQIGYNWQFGSFVLGLETDIEFTNVHDKGATFGPGSLAKSYLNWFGSVRGKLGYSFGRTLVYATGGFAYGGVDDEVSVFDGATKKDNTETGYTVGGGIEYSIAPAWSLTTEYQYIDLGHTTLLAVGDYSAAQLTAEHQYHTVRMGVNYHLGTYEPLK
jgi:outer membrane immunogenic protein